MSIKPNRGEGIGYNACPPPMHNNFLKTPKVDKVLNFNIFTPLVADPCAVSGNSATTADSSEHRSESSNSASTSETVEVEEIFDAEELKPVEKSANIPDANHIGCKPSDFVTMYQLKGSSRIYSDLDFPIGNINPNKIKRRFKVEKKEGQKLEDQVKCETSNLGKDACVKKAAKKPQNVKTRSKDARKSGGASSKKSQTSKKAQPMKSVHKQWKPNESSSEESIGRFGYKSQTSSHTSSRTSSTRSQSLKYVRHSVDRRTCYACGEVGHVSYKCPNFQKPQAKQFSDNFVTPKQFVSKCPNLKVDVEKKSKTFEKQNVNFLQRVLMMTPELHSGSSGNTEKLMKQSTFRAFWRPRSNVSSKISTSVVCDPKIYYKRAFLKRQMWRPKGVSDVEDTSSMSSEEWLDAISEDEKGQSRTIRAWFPNFY